MKKFRNNQRVWVVIHKAPSCTVIGYHPHIEVFETEYSDNYDSERYHTVYLVLSPDRTDWSNGSFLVLDEDIFDSHTKACEGACSIIKMYAEQSKQECKKAVQRAKELTNCQEKLQIDMITQIKELQQRGQQPPPKKCYGCRRTREKVWKEKDDV